jgi:nicotinate-nucleotide adenylyltransferase
MKLGIFGGTFDPPHIGHLILADEALNQLHLDQILWVLTPKSPHKAGKAVSALNNRLKMVNIIIEDNPDFELSTVDVNRLPPYFAIDSLRLLADEYPKDDLIYLLGGDSLENLPLWHKPIEFVKTCKKIGVMSRPGTGYDLKSLDNKIPGLGSKIISINSPQIDISATEIRKRIRQNLSFRYFLHPSIYKIIKENRLYLRD